MDDDTVPWPIGYGVAQIARDLALHSNGLAVTSMSRSSNELEVARDRVLAGNPIKTPGNKVPPVRYLLAENGGNPAFRDIAERVRQAIPGSDVETVPGLPHFAMATEPAAFVARAVEHLQRHA